MFYSEDEITQTHKLGLSQKNQINKKKEKKKKRKNKVENAVAKRNSKEATY